MMNHREIINDLAENIKSLNLEDSISAANALGEYIWKNEINIFSLKNIEEYLSNEASKNITLKKTVSQLDNERNLFIATTLYSHGGHSRLAENLASYLDKKPDLITTNNLQQSILKKESLYFNSIYQTTYKANIEKIEEIAYTIIKYNNIILFTHPNDILAILACSLAKKYKPDLKIFFVNHADHVFSFGSSVADVWFEISTHGINIDKNRELLCKKSFIGIPIKNKKNTGRIINFKDGDLIISAASGYKYKPRNGLSILPLIDLLLAKYPNSKMKIIGVNIKKDYWWWRLKSKYIMRLSFIKNTPYQKYLEICSNATLYIDSTPLTGGTAFAEQYLSGKMCSGLNSYISGYTPLDSFKQETPDDVLNFIQNYQNEDFKDLEYRLDYTHNPENVKKRFINALHGEITKYELRYKKSVTPFFQKIKICKLPNNLYVKDTKTLIAIFKLSTFKVKIKLIAKFLIKKHKYL